jgi:hypothetical protein
MFPLFSSKEIIEAARYYTALNVTMPTAADQAIAIMGEGSCDIAKLFMHAIANII